MTRLRLRSAYLFYLLLYLRLATLVSCDDTTSNITISTTTLSPIPTIVSSARSFTWTESVDSNSVVYEVESGYFISVTVSDVEFSNGNYLLIEGGNETTEGATDGRVFANSVKGPIKYFFKTNSVYGFFENTRLDDTNPSVAKFIVKFETVGDGTTTVSTTSSTTTVSVPPTQEDDSIYITVNITGRHPSEYTQAVKTDFKTCIASLATSYCKNNNFELTTTISVEYVMISDIRQCPYNWPDSSTCTQIRFKLPIFYTSSQWTGYQLSTEHLEKMWSRKEDEPCFSEHSFGDYNEPDYELAITWWAIGIALVIVAFVVLLWFSRIFSSRIKTALNRKNRNRRNSDTVSIVSSKKESVASLTPHYLQDHLDTSTPKMFDIYSS